VRAGEHYADSVRRLREARARPMCGAVVIDSDDAQCVAPLHVDAVRKDERERREAHIVRKS
jgi:hypothetical protein